MDASLLASAPTDDLTEAVVQLHAAGCAIRKAMLEVVAAFDNRRLWADDGATSMAAWLVARDRLPRPGDQDPRRLPARMRRSNPAEREGREEGKRALRTQTPGLASLRDIERI